MIENQPLPGMPQPLPSSEPVGPLSHEEVHRISCHTKDCDGLCWREEGFWGYESFRVDLFADGIEWLMSRQLFDQATNEVLQGVAEQIRDELEAANEWRRLSERMSDQVVSNELGDGNG